MKAYADAVVNTFHVLLARSPQVFDYLTLVDGDDLFCLTHGGFIQTVLRTEVSLCCDGSMLYIGSNPILTGRFTLPPPNGDRCVHPLMWLPITVLCLKNGM